MSLLHEFGAAVRQYRERMGLSQEEFALAAGIDRTYISGIERGTRNPSLRMIGRLADALGVELDALFGTVMQLRNAEKDREP